MSKPNPAVTVAKELKGGVREKHVTLSSGDEAILRPVTASLIDEVTSRVRDPEVPMWFNEAKEREEPNPSDPKYLRAMDEANRERGVAAMDAMIMFGVELVNGLPDNENWVKKLRFLEKRGQLSLKDYDLEDEFDRTFLYLRYIAVDSKIIGEITGLSGMSAEEIEQAEDSFPDNT